MLLCALTSPMARNDDPSLELYCSCLPSVNISSPAASNTRARSTYAKWKEPVAFLTNPRRYGPTDPPMLPHELMKPTASAAAIPDRNEGANVQR